MSGQLRKYFLLCYNFTILLKCYAFYWIGTVIIFTKLFKFCFCIDFKNDDFKTNAINIATTSRI